MRRLTYWLARTFARLVFFCTIKVEWTGSANARRQGGYVLVCNHIDHFDPVCLSVIVPRKIDWMGRIEFFHGKLSARLMHALDVFAVNRRGSPLRAIRTAIARVRAGRVVGIFPEGEITRDANSALFAGQIKSGACVVSRWGRVPIVPCVIVGTPALNKPATWMPFRRGKIWLICGESIWPDHVVAGSRRDARLRMAEQVRATFMRLHEELQARYKFDETVVRSL